MNTIHTVMLWYLIRPAYNRIFSGKFIENHLHVHMICCPIAIHNEFMFNFKFSYMHGDIIYI